ncbi:MAG TPA: hypothetical protein PLV68_16300, partial [Ilumatobacteraceae bacterium]|nr:hypothetical protein [Ilumatobacteraceae bacterium]
GSQQAQAIDGTSFTAEPGAAYNCAITNTKLGQITVVKNVDGADGTFDFNGTFASPNGFQLTTVGGTANQLFNSIPAGTYSLSELELPSDYDGVLLCSETGTKDTTVNGLVGTINLQAGESVTCTFTNTQRSTILVDKVTNPSGDATEFDFTLGATPFTLTDAAAPFSSGLVVPGTYTVTELAETGWTLTGLSCPTGVRGSSASIVGSAAEITLTAGDTITCTYTNAKLGSVTVDKDASAITHVPVDGFPNRYQVDYTVVATNGAYVPTTYDAVDALSFGGNTTIVSATVLSKPDDVTLVAGWNGQGNTLLADDAAIAARGTHTYTIRVVFDVAPAITPSERDCRLGTDENGTGTLNTVTVTAPNGGDDDDACTPIPDPNVKVAKSVSSAPLRNADGTWTIGYDVTVTNTTDDTHTIVGPGTYVANDTLAFGGDVTVVSVTASAVTSGLAANVNDDFDGAASGDTELAAGSIAAGATHVYRVTVVADVVPTTTGGGECDASFTSGRGFVNRATVTVDDVTTPPSSACAPYATLTLNKVLHNDDGGVATLSDFVLSATPTTPDGAAAIINGADPDGTKNAAPADGVTAAVPVGSYTLAETEQSGYTAGNWVCTGGTVTNDVVVVTAGADVICTIVNDDDPVDLQLTKDDGGAVAVAGGPAYDYTITVVNVGTRNPDLGEPVTVTDILPAGLSFVTVPSNCTTSGQIATCDIDPALLKVGDDPVVITISVKLAAGAPAGTYVNKAFVTTEDDPACVGDHCVPECPPT